MQWNSRQRACHRHLIIFALTNIIALVMVLGGNHKPLIQDIKLMHAFSQMGVCASSGCAHIKENCLIFHMLPYKIFHLRRPIAYFEQPLFNFWLKAWTCASHPYHNIL